jgi:hypothetical protein
MRANIRLADIREFLQLAAQANLRPKPLDACLALSTLRNDNMRRAKVLRL